MTGIPTPEAVKAMTDIPPDRLDEIRDEFTGYNHRLKLSRVSGTPTMGEFYALLSMAARAPPSPRRYTGGPLEDGLYLWRKPNWHPVRFVSMAIEDGITEPYRKPGLLGGEWVWLIGPIHIPPIPESEEAIDG